MMNGLLHVIYVDINARKDISIKLKQKNMRSANFAIMRYFTSMII